MRIITTHLTADFDAFCAAVVATRLYPDHRVLFPGSQEAAVRRFVEDVNPSLPLVRLREARRHTLEHAVVVDTRNPDRLGEVWDLIRRDGCPMEVIDHHRHEEGLEAENTVFRAVGSTCTIIADLLRERSEIPSTEEATLLLMGLYEDTGGLSYAETTPDDLRVAAWLLEHGGRLDWVRRWVLKGLRPDQLALLNHLVENADEVDVNGRTLAISAVEVEEYQEEAAYVVHRWVETFDLPVGVALIVRPPNVNVIIRSQIDGFHAGRVARSIGGGGHAAAASARVGDTVAIEVIERILDAAQDELPAPATAGEIAGRKIFTIDAVRTVSEAKERMNRLRVNALPVRDESSSGLVGTVTRQVLDQALSHELGARPVSSVMHPGVPQIDAGARLDELRDLFLERSCRFVVVLKDGRPWGLVTRMTLFRHLFGAQSRAGETLDNRIAGTRPVTQAVTKQLRNVPPEWVRNVLAVVRELAEAEDVAVFLVGGMVRDLLLQRPNEDLDLVVEGNGLEFAEALGSRLGAKVHPYEPFLTAVLTLPSGKKVDVASARTEFYRTPASLPEVETSLIRQDLYRRDFTINALAVELRGEVFGRLLDFFGGRRDLNRGEIRVLHSMSFLDDPTRAVRAVRYARRLGFALASDTEHLIRTAVEEGVFDRLSGPRLRKELEQLFAEPHPSAALEVLADLGLLEAVDPALEWTEAIHSRLLDLEALTAWFELERVGTAPSPVALYLGALTLDADEDVAARIAGRLQVDRETARALRRLADGVRELRRLTEEGAPPSRLAGAGEAAGSEAVLMAMAELDLSSRRRLGRALEAARRLEPPVCGADLLEEGLSPGPHIGIGLRAARNALLDGEIEPDRALPVAVDAARRALGERP